MRSSAIAFLMVGFGIGFAAIYPWMRQRAPEVGKPIPVITANSGAPASVPPPPPLDTARVQQLEQQAAANPANADVLTELGNIQFEQENYPAAVDWYKRVLDVEPENINVRTDMGGAMFYAGRIDESIAEFNRVLQLQPGHPQALFNLGVAYLEGKQDRAKALEAWETLVATNPSFPQVDLVKEQIERLRAQ